MHLSAWYALSVLCGLWGACFALTGWRLELASTSRWRRCGAQLAWLIVSWWGVQVLATLSVDSAVVTPWPRDVVLAVLPSLAATAVLEGAYGGRRVAEDDNTASICEWFARSVLYAVGLCFTRLPLMSRVLATSNTGSIIVQIVAVFLALLVSMVAHALLFRQALRPLIVAAFVAVSTLDVTVAWSAVTTTSDEAVGDDIRNALLAVVMTMLVASTHVLTRLTSVEEARGSATPVALVSPTSSPYSATTQHRRVVPAPTSPLRVTVLGDLDLGDEERRQWLRDKARVLALNTIGEELSRWLDLMTLTSAVDGAEEVATTDRYWYEWLLDDVVNRSDARPFRKASVSSSMARPIAEEESELETRSRAASAASSTDSTVDVTTRLRGAPSTSPRPTTMRHVLNHPLACSLFKRHLEQHAPRQAVSSLQFLLLVRKWRLMRVTSSSVGRCMDVTRGLWSQFVRRGGGAGEAGGGRTLALSDWIVRHTTGRVEWLASLSEQQAIDDFPYDLFVAAESEVWRGLDEHHWGSFTSSPVWPLVRQIVERHRQKQQLLMSSSYTHTSEMSLVRMITENCFSPQAGGGATHASQRMKQ